MSRKDRDRVGAWLNNPNIGRRTGVDLKAGKNIRKFSDGVENFDDYWTDSSEGEDSYATLQRDNDTETPASTIIGLGVKPMSPFSASSQTSVPTSASLTIGAIEVTDTSISDPQETPNNNSKVVNELLQDQRANSEFILNPAGDEVGTITRPDVAKPRTEPGSALSGVRTKKRLTYSHGSDRESISKDLHQKSPSKAIKDDTNDSTEEFKKPSSFPLRKSLRKSESSPTPLVTSNAETKTRPPSKSPTSVSVTREENVSGVDDSKEMESDIIVRTNVVENLEHKRTKTSRKSSSSPRNKQLASVKSTPIESETFDTGNKHVSAEGDLGHDQPSNESLARKTPLKNNGPVKHEGLEISPCFVALEPLATDRRKTIEVGRKSGASPLSVRKSATSPVVVVDRSVTPPVVALSESYETSPIPVPRALSDSYIYEPKGKDVSTAIEDEDDEFEILDTSVVVGKPSPTKMKTDQKTEAHQRKPRSPPNIKKGSAPTSLPRRHTQPAKSKQSKKDISKKRRKSDATKEKKWFKTFSGDSEDENEIILEENTDENQSKRKKNVPGKTLVANLPDGTESNTEAKEHTKKDNKRKKKEIKKNRKKNIENVLLEDSESEEHILTDKRTVVSGKRDKKKARTKPEQNVSGISDTRNIPKRVRGKRVSILHKDDNNQDENLSSLNSNEVRHKSIVAGRRKKDTYRKKNNDSSTSLLETVDSEDNKTRQHKPNVSTRGTQRNSHASSVKSTKKSGRQSKNHLSKEASQMSYEHQKRGSLKSFIMHTSEEEENASHEGRCHSAVNAKARNGKNHETNKQGRKRSKNNEFEEVDNESDASVDLEEEQEQVVGADMYDEAQELESGELVEVEGKGIGDDIGQDENDEIFTTEEEQQEEQEELGEDMEQDMDESQKEREETDADGGQEEDFREEVEVWETEEELEEGQSLEEDNEQRYMELQPPRKDIFNAGAGDGPDVEEELVIYEISKIEDDEENLIESTKQEDKKSLKKRNDSETNQGLKQKNTKSKGKEGKARSKKVDGQTLRRSSRPRVSPVAWYNNEVPDFTTSSDNRDGSYLDIRTSQQLAHRTSRKRSTSSDKSGSTATGSPRVEDIEEEISSPPIVKRKRGKPKKISMTPNLEVSDVRRKSTGPASSLSAKAKAHSRRSILRKPGTPRTSVGPARFAENLPTYTPSTRKSNVLPRYSTSSPVHINERTCSQTPVGDPFGRVHSKKTEKIVKPTTPNGSIRRSKRTRVKRLDWNRNERILYKHRKSGGFVITGIEAAEDRKVDVNKKENLEQLVKNKRRRGRAPNTPRNLKADKMVNCNIDAKKQTAVVVVNPDSCEEVEIDCIRSRDTLAYRGAKSISYDHTDPFISCKALLQATFSAGKLLIRPLQKKERQVVKNGTMVFYVIHGMIALTLHQSSTVMESGDFFFIPRGNAYSLENLRDVEAKLTFFQIKDG